MGERNRGDFVRSDASAGGPEAAVPNGCLPSAAVEKREADQGEVRVRGHQEGSLEREGRDRLARLRLGSRWQEPSMEALGIEAVAVGHEAGR